MSATTAPTSASAYPSLHKITKDNTMLKSVTFAPLRSPPLPTDQREAMLDGTSRLLEILSWRRPHGSEAELEFMLEYLTPLKDHQNVSAYDVDGFGNIWVTVGDNPDHPLLFSCHVDTVSTKGGRQAIGWSAEEQDIICLVKKQAGRSLGADDGAGLWLLLEMIDAGQSGRYVFHRGEESGRLGSIYAAEHEPHRLDNVMACIAFDRRDHDNLITHQMGQRGCSIDFADSLIEAIGSASNGKVRYRHDDTGSYTDSYSYFDLVSECTNLSIGYDGEHGPRETLDAAHVWRLRNAMVKADLLGLRFTRDPSERESYRGNYGGGWTFDYEDSYYKPATRSPQAHQQRNALDVDRIGQWEDLEQLEALVINYPMKAAELLQDLGLASWEFIEALPEDEQGQALSASGY